MKRNHLIILVLLLAIFVGWGFSFNKAIDLSSYQLGELKLCYHVPSESELIFRNYPNSSYSLFLGKTFVGFKEAVGFKESGGDYFTVNQYGYMGKYQFGKGTLQMIGIHDTEEFLSDSFLQEKAFTANTERNKWILRKDIQRNRGKFIEGIKITESGILAAAHLAGPGNVKKFLRSGGLERFEDANGTSIRYYLKIFSGYDTSMIVANKSATVH